MDSRNSQIGCHAHLPCAGDRQSTSSCACAPAPRFRMCHMPDLSCVVPGNLFEALLQIQGGLRILAERYQTMCHHILRGSHRLALFELHPASCCKKAPCNILHEAHMPLESSMNSPHPPCVWSFLGIHTQ